MMTDRSSSILACAAGEEGHGRSIAGGRQS